jgi:hypothetical protein
MTRTVHVDERLKEYATTERQREYVDAVNEHKGVLAAADALGIGFQHISKTISELKRRAARQSATQHQDVNNIPDGFAITGTSTLTKTGDGIQWVKTSADKQRQEEMLREAIAVLSQECKGLAPIVKPPENVLEDLMCVIPVGDPHFGLYVWAQECGADFDTDIARKLSIAAADRLISSVPHCSIGILLLLGDITHANDQTNATPGHKHQLDVDSRFVKVIGITIETWRHIILRMKEKFGRVIGKLLPGNHDPQAVWALAYTLHAYFSNDPDVQIDLGPSKFWYYAFGKVLLGSTHGDTVKPEKLPSIMAADRPQEWGASVHRYWYTGHIHSKNTIEFPGVMWESFRTLAAPDSYASTHGYRSGRDMVAIVHHREHGEVERHRCDVGMLA